VVVALAFCDVASASTTDQRCEYDEVVGQIICIATGGEETPTSPATPAVDDDPELRYVYTSTDPVVGDCYYWSAIPGGLDAWNPANEPAVITIVASLPVCPNPPPLDPEIRAWELFRSWDLAPPSPRIAPDAVGITGLPSHVAANTPAPVDYTEVLPDGRTLAVRATVTLLTVDWGDGTLTHHDPGTALGYPSGSVQHSYTLKTCPAAYRRTHPSGPLCHPTLERYSIAVTYRWTGEFAVGAGWNELGSLDRTAVVPYDVDEARGVPVPEGSVGP